MRRSPRWEEFSTPRKVATVLLSIVQVSLALCAWIDLARRPAAQVNGPKGRWAAVIAVNFVGPILYFLRGRRTTSG
jgi:hypothetical protein